MLEEWESDNLNLINHPKKCPNCWGKNTFTYERFDSETEHGSYLCDDCGFCIDAFNGDVLDEGINFGSEFNKFISIIAYQLKLDKLMDWVEKRMP